MKAGLQRQQGEVVEGHQRTRLLPEAIRRWGRGAQVGDEADVPERTAPSVDCGRDRLGCHRGQIDRRGSLRRRRCREHQCLAQPRGKRREQLGPVCQDDRVGRNEVQGRPDRFHGEGPEHRDLAFDLERTTRLVLLDVEELLRHGAGRRRFLTGARGGGRGDPHARRGAESRIPAGDDRLGSRDLKGAQHGQRAFRAEVMAAGGAGPTGAALDLRRVSVRREGGRFLGQVAEDRQAACERSLLGRQRQDEGPLGEFDAAGIELAFEQPTHLGRGVAVDPADQRHVSSPLRR